MKDNVAGLYEENDCDTGDDSDDDAEEKTEYSTEISDFFLHTSIDIYALGFNSYTHSTYFYLLKHYYVIDENLSPPPELLI